MEHSIIFNSPTHHPSSFRISSHYCWLFPIPTLALYVSVLAMIFLILEGNRVLLLCNLLLDLRSIIRKILLFHILSSSGLSFLCSGRTTGTVPQPPSQHRRYYCVHVVLFLHIRFQSRSGIPSTSAPGCIPDRRLYSRITRRYHGNFYLSFSGTSQKSCIRLRIVKWKLARPHASPEVRIL